MKKNLLIIVVALVVLGGGVTAYAVLNNKADDKKTTESATTGDSSTTDMDGMPQDQGTQAAGTSTDTGQGGGTTGSAGSGNGASNTASTDQVKISNFAFSPASITIKIGTKVTWTNGDEVKHNVAMDDGAEGPSSQMLGKGDTYTYTFTKAGTFKYHCTPHPSMKGAVIVTE